MSDSVMDALRSVLCDSEGNVCIAGPEGDRQVIQTALVALDERQKEMRRLWRVEFAVQQYAKGDELLRDILDAFEEAETP